jgi:hypothetical protein
MKCNAMKSLQYGALFFIIASPDVYKLTGGDVLLHSLVFALVVLLLKTKKLI